MSFQDHGIDPIVTLAASEGMFWMSGKIGIRPHTGEHNTIIDISLPTHVLTLERTMLL